jgi:hypothetical protein
MRFAVKVVITTGVSSVDRQRDYFKVTPAKYK